MYFGSIAIIATEISTNVWTPKAFSVDNVENLGPAFDIENVTVATSKFFTAALAMAHGSRRGAAEVNSVTRLS